MQQRRRLGQVDDVDVVAGAIDEGRHLGVPAVRLVTEVNASFQKLTHRERGKRHDGRSFFRLNLHGTRKDEAERPNPPERWRGCLSARREKSRVWDGGLITGNAPLDKASLAVERSSRGSVQQILKLEGDIDS